MTAAAPGRAGDHCPNAPYVERRHPATYTAEQVADLLQVSAWSVYQASRRNEPPIGTLAIKVGRRLVWPRAAVDRLLGLVPEG